MSNNQLFTIDSTPGLFTTDSPAANPHPEKLLGYGPNDKTATIGDAQNVTSCGSFFMPGVWSSKDELTDDDTAWHMYSGMRQPFNLGFCGKKFNQYEGTGHLFSSSSPTLYRIGDDNCGEEVGLKRNSLQVYTGHQMTHNAGLLIGSRYTDSAALCTARWMSPIGIQFKWHNVFSKAQASGMRLQYLFLIYTDNWAPSKLLYAPIIYGGQKTNGNTYTRGNDILALGNENESDKGGHSAGQFVGFVDSNSMGVIKDKYTNSACIGIYFTLINCEYNWATYDHVHDFWDFKLLFDTGNNDSRIVVPEPMLLKERMDDYKVKLL